jgi:hypothetical protein
VLPIHTPVVPVIGNGLFAILTTLVEKQPVAVCVNDMVAVPGTNAETTPLDDPTDAIDGAEELQVPVTVSLLNTRVAPTHIMGLPIGLIVEGTGCALIKETILQPVLN